MFFWLSGERGRGGERGVGSGDGPGGDARRHDGLGGTRSPPREPGPRERRRGSAHDIPHGESEPPSAPRFHDGRPRASGTVAPRCARSGGGRPHFRSLAALGAGCSPRPPLRALILRTPRPPPVAAAAVSTTARSPPMALSSNARRSAASSSSRRCPGAPCGCLPAASSKWRPARHRSSWGDVPCGAVCRLPRASVGERGGCPWGKPEDETSLSLFHLPPVPRRKKRG